MKHKNSGNIVQISSELLSGIATLIDNARSKAAVILNTETTLLYWGIGDYINNHLKRKGQVIYGSKIVATVSQQLACLYDKSRMILRQAESFKNFRSKLRVAKLRPEGR